MTDPAGFERADELVSRALIAGFSVGAGQIARWSRDGLLPRKLKQHGLGQGKGSEIRYPIGTAAQLLALCQFRRDFRKLEVVGWYLWLNGFPVDNRYWRAPLVSAANAFSGHRQLLRRRFLDTTGGIVSLRSSGSEFLATLSEARIENQEFRRARRRVGSDQIGEFVRLVATLAAGPYRAGAEHNEQDQAAEAKIFERGFGLTRAWTDKLKNGLTLLSGPIEPDLERLSVRLGKISKAHLMRSITPDRMTRARYELGLLLSGLKMTRDHFEKDHGKHAFGLGVLVEFAMITEIRLQALIILLFEVAIRSDQSNRLQEILAAIKVKRIPDERQSNST